jgi:hypothetical protein
VKIRRSKLTENFTILPNELLRDDRLTYCARGILAELLSRPSGWETNADALSDRARRHRGDIVGEGRRALRMAFKELETAGYMVRRKEKEGNGRFNRPANAFVPSFYAFTRLATGVGGRRISSTPRACRALSGRSSSPVVSAQPRVSEPSRCACTGSNSP